VAELVPPNPPEKTPIAEIKVRDSLARLEDRWAVFHSVAWQSLRGGVQADGEADFVLAHPEHGIVLLEVKGGNVSVMDGQWFSVDTSTGQKHRIKNPVKQALDSKYALVRYLDELDPPLKGMPIVHGVVFPTGSVDQSIGMAVPRDIVWDGGDLRDPEHAMTRLLKHWGGKAKITGSQMRQLRQLLAPTYQIRPRLRNVIAEAGEQLLKLTDEQIRALNGLRRNRRAIVYGSAGTGKTVLAIERARRLSEEGFSVLLTCYNGPLGEFLADAVRESASVTAGSFHSVCLRLMKEAGMRVPRSPSQEWWRTDAPDLMLRAAEKTGRNFDAIVVDEGQDFAPGWFEGLTILLSDLETGPFYVFADTQQAIYLKDWTPPGEWPAFDLDVNCRNTLPIAVQVAKIFGTKPNSLGATGPDPRFVVADSEEDAVDLLLGSIKHLIREEMVDPSQIAIIGGSRDLINELHSLSAGSRIVPMGQKGVVAETIHRFKGMESDVLYVLLSGLDLSSKGGRALAYVAMSRARSVLMVLGSKRQAKELGWPSKLVLEK
jgi:hypothetical protein